MKVIENYSLSTADSSRLIFPDILGRAKFLSKFYTRVSSLIEIEQYLDADFHLPPGEAWSRANKYLAQVAQADPQEAINLAFDFLNVSTGKLNDWIRTSGLMLLGLKEVSLSLTNFLATNPEASKLAKNLHHLMENDLSPFTSQHSFDGNPLGYSAVQAVFIGLGLEEAHDSLSSELFHHAQIVAAKPETKIATKFLSQYDECAYLKTRISPSE